VASGQWRQSLWPPRAAHNWAPHGRSHHDSHAAPMVAARHRGEAWKPPISECGRASGRAGRAPARAFAPAALAPRPGGVVPGAGRAIRRPSVCTSPVSHQRAGSVHRRGGSVIEQRPCIAEIGADRVPGPAPPGDEVAAERAERCLQRLRQRLRQRLWVRDWLRFRFWFRRRQWSRLRPGFRPRRWGHRWRHWRRLHWFGPRRLRLRGFRLRCLTGTWSGVWRHFAGHFVAGHRGPTGTICEHPEIIPSRALRPYAAADLYRRPVRLPAHPAPASGPSAEVPAARGEKAWS
jgi:hypothetical protein